MAEVLKEFANVALTGASFDSSGEYTVLTNNSTTQAVIKDINAGVTGVLVNTNVEVNQGISTIATGGNSTGFELVPVSGVLKVKLNPIPNGGTSAELKVQAASSTTLTHTDIFQAGVAGNYALKSTSSYIVTPSSTSKTTPTMSNPFVWQYVNQANNKLWYFSYDGNSTTTLKYATIYASGTVSGFSISDSVTYGYTAIDPVASKAYKQSSTYGVKEINLETGASTTYSAAFSGITGAINKSSYNKGAACKGVFFCQPTNAYTDRIQYFDTATGNNGRINGTFLCGAEGATAVTYNPVEQRYYILTKSYTTTSLSYIDATTLSGNYTATLVGASGISVDSTCRFIGATETGLFGWASGNTNKIGLATSTGVTTYSSFASEYTLSNYNGPVVKAATPSTVPASDLDIGINLKVSGVEITGV
jgi:hypothetical protein